MNSNSNQSRRLTQRKFWIHKRTLAVIFSVVIVPWVLISIPGEVVGGGGTSGINITTRKHGWPFVQLDSTRIEVYGNWPKSFVDEFFADTSQSLLEQDPNVETPLQLNLYLHRATYWMEDHPGFWLDRSNWPSWNRDWNLRFHPLGLFCNILFVGLAMIFVGSLVEIIIRRQGKLFRFSLKTVLAFVVGSAALLAFGVSEHSKSSHEERCLRQLKKLEAEQIGYFNVGYKSRFPLLISHLFNNGKFPWGDSMMFRQIEECWVTVYLRDSNTPEQISQFSSALANSNVSVSLDVHFNNELSAKMLDELSKSRVIELNLQFDCYDWIDQKIGPQAYGESWKKAAKLADLKFETKNRFHHLETLVLELNDVMNQKDLLHQFHDLPKLKHVTVCELSEAGANYILQTRSNWPKTLIFECAEEVPEELKLKLRQAFPNTLPIYPD